jgi:hypothetical protein
MTLDAFLPDRDWRSLLRDIRSEQVIPVIGPAAVMVHRPSLGPVDLIDSQQRYLSAAGR